jgi:hypothetical protein
MNKETRVCLREPARDHRKQVTTPSLPPQESIIGYRPQRGHRVHVEIQHTMKSITRWPSPWS